MQFSDLSLIEPLQRAVAAEGYETPTPIQQQAIPPILLGRDLLGCAQTGTGKTAAFALPMLQRLTETRPRGVARPAPERHAHAPARHPRDSRQPLLVGPIRALILTPTRELAAQIGDSFATYGRHLRLRHTVIFGGVGQLAQEQALARGPEIVVATPGRLLDLAQQRKIDLQDIEIFVLDEADRMLDMGFIHDVRRVIALLPQKRQTLFFSATMPPDIIELSSRILTDPARVAVAPIASTAEKVEQKVFFVERSNKRALLERVLGDPTIERALVFTRTKHGANRVAEQLDRARIGAEVIHGNKSQTARERALDNFKRGATRVLVATDIAARGIDVEGISHVINFDLPDVPESYVHRIGRTARAGASGIAFSFCDRDEMAMLGAIERLIRARIPVDAQHVAQRMGPPSPEPAAEERRYRGGDASRGRPPAHSRGGPSNHHRGAPSNLLRASAGTATNSGSDTGARESASPSTGAPRRTGRSFSPRPRKRYAAS